MLRVWKREKYFGVMLHKFKKEPPIIPEEQIGKELSSRTRLSELSLIVDTGGVYKEEEEIIYGI